MMVLYFNNISSPLLTALHLMLLYILIIPQVQTEGHFPGTNSRSYFPNSLFLGLLRFIGKHWAPPSGQNQKCEPKAAVQKLWLLNKSPRATYGNKMLFNKMIFILFWFVFHCQIDANTHCHSPKQEEKYVNTVQVKNYIISQNINGKIKRFNCSHAFVKINHSS